jgi:hypothetical protein
VVKTELKELSDEWSHGAWRKAVREMPQPYKSATLVLLAGAWLLTCGFVILASSLVSRDMIPSSRRSNGGVK